MTEERKREANSSRTKHETAVGAEVDSELYVHALVPSSAVL